MEKFTPHLPERDPDSSIPVADEKDLVPDQEVRNLLVQYTPAAMKDIALIEHGVENFHSFHDSPEALTHMDRIQFLALKDLRYLDTKNALRVYQYLRTTADASKLEVQTVLIRPSDLSGARVLRIKRACVRESAYSIIRHLLYRERIMAQLEERAELGTWLRRKLLGDLAGLPMRKVSDAALKTIPGLFANLSFEHFLESEIAASLEIKESVLGFLAAAPGADGSLEAETAVPEDIRKIILTRGGKPMLLRLSPSCHVVCPALASDSSGPISRGELDYVAELYAEAARSILIAAAGQDPARVTYATLAELHRLLASHPGLQNPAGWPRGQDFITEVGELSQLEDQLATAKREHAVNSILERVTKQLTMRFEPLLFEPQSAVVSLPDQMRALFPDTSVAAGVILARIKSNPEIVTFADRRGPGAEERIHLIYKGNLPGAFERHAEKRSFYHLLAKENGFTQGIYAFVNPALSAGPLAEEQTRLLKAIKEWEHELEEERLKRERENLGFFARLWESILSLFGLSRYSRRVSDRAALHSAKSDSGRAIPARLKKVVEYVERNNRGLIWLDEVLRYLKNQYTPDEVAQLLDQGPAGLYREVDRLSSRKRLFVRNSNLASADWRQATLDRLESRFSPGPEVRALMDYIREFEGE